MKMQSPPSGFTPMTSPAGARQVRNRVDLASIDPGQLKTIDDTIGLLKQNLIPEDIQLEILDATPAATQRIMVSRIAGLDATVLVTLKAQLSLVDSVLRKLVNEDGSYRVPVKGDDGPGISLKDALNLSIKVSQVITRDLPKVFTVERVQKQEEALQHVMESMMSAEQQAEFLRQLELIENGK